MGQLRRIGVGWTSFLVVLTLSVAGAGAVVVTDAGSPPEGGSRALLAAGVGEGTDVPAPPTTAAQVTTTTAAGLRSAPMATPAPAPGLAPPPMPTTTIATGTRAPATTVPTVTGTSPVIGPPPVIATPPATVSPLGAKSWELEANGVSMRIRLEPQTVRAGDTVQFVFQSFSAVATDFCCMDHLYVGGALVHSRSHQGACPMLSTPGEQRFSYVVPQSGVLAFHLQSSRVNLCNGGPPLFATANLHASTPVLAANP